MFIRNKVKLLITSLFVLSFFFVVNSTYSANVTSAATGNWSATAWPNTLRTGTITASTTNNSVVGSGTAFLDELSVGNIIKTTSNVVIGTVASIESNTNLTLVSNAAINHTTSSYNSQGVGLIDAITIGNHVITVDGNFSCASVNMTAASATKTITFSGSSQLSVTGTFTMARPGSGFNFTLNLNAGTLTCATFAMGASTSGRNDIVNITTGTLNCAGNITTGTGGSGCQVNITGAGRLEMGGTTVGTFTLSPGSSSTVVYDAGGNQTVRPVTYNNLILAGSGTKTTTSTTVNGLITYEGTAISSAAPTFGANAGIVFNTTSARTVTSFQWPATFTATRGVRIASTGIITLNEAKVIDVGDSLTIESGATLATGNFQVTIGGHFTNDGTFSAGSSNIVINGTTAQNIGGFTTTGTVSMTKTGTSTATFTGNVNGGPLTINGTGGTLNLGAGLSHVFTGTFTRTAGTVEGGSSTITFGANGSGVGANFIPGTSTVRWNGAAQNVSGMEYYNIVLEGTDAKSLSTLLTTVNNDFRMLGSATTSTTVGISIAGKLIIGDNNTFTAAGFDLTVGDSLIIGSGTGGTFTISSATGAKNINGSLIVNSGGTFNNTAANVNLSIGGHFRNDGTFNAGSATYTLTGSSKEISGTISLPSLTISGSYTNLGTLSLSSSLLGAGSLSNGTTGVLNINFTGTPSITSLTATATGNTVNYGFAGTQTIVEIDYHHLTLSNSGVKTLQSGTTNIGGNLVLSGTASTSAVVGLSIGGNLELATGTSFNTGSFTYNVGGNISLASGTTTNFSSNTLNLTGTTQSFSNAVGVTTFANLGLSSGEKTFSTNIKCNSTLTLNSGSILAMSSGVTVEIAGNITGTGTMKAQACGDANSTLLFTGSTSAGTLRMESGFENVSAFQYQKTAGTLTVETPLIVSSTFEVPTSGTATVIFNNELNLVGAVSVTNTTGRVTMNSTSSLKIGGCVTSGTLITLPNGFFSAAPSITNLTLDRTNGFTLGNQMITVTGVVTLTSGTLTTNGNLTLASSASGTARVAPVTGAISGNVTAERFIPGGSNKRKWRFLSSPVNVSGSIALSQYIDDIFVTAPAGAGGGFDVNPFANNASIRTYTESTAGASLNGWTNPTNITNTITTGTGIEVFVRGSRNLANPYLNWTVPDNVTIDYIGSLTTGNVVKSLSFTNTGAGTADGLNLVGNPYASPINFDSTGWTKTNMEDKFWCYNPVTATYGIYVSDNGNGIGTNGITKYIASGQAFFVRATSSGASLTFTENVKCVQAGNQYFKPNNNSSTTQKINITISNDSLESDESIIMLSNDYSFDPYDNFDAGKFFNDRLNIYTVSNGYNMAINARPFPVTSDTVILPVWSYDTTSVNTIPHIIKFDNIKTIDPSIVVYLQDNYTNTIRNLREITGYPFTMSSDANSYGNNRFKIIFQNNNTSIQNIKNNRFDLSIYPNPTEGSLTIKLDDAFNNRKIKLEVVDLLGKIVMQNELEVKYNTVQLNVEELNKGTYILRITDEHNSSLAKFVKK